MKSLFSVKLRKTQHKNRKLERKKKKHFECQTTSDVIIREANFQVHAADETTIKSISD